MRIALISTLSTPVRRDGSGSVEGLLWLLARELTRMGHEITVFGAAGSEIDGEVVATLPGPYGAAGSPDDWQLCEWINLCRAVEQSARFDVLHSHAYLWGLPLESLSRAPMLHTLHICPYSSETCLRAMYPGAAISAISSYQWGRMPGEHPLAIIHHGVDREQFTFRPQPEEYLFYLGRFTPGKGPVQAIAAARAVGMRLVLAGPRNDYYSTSVEPLVDGQSVEYAGSVTGAERNRLLGGARVLLYPIQEPEPFGLVPVEAMMCGTPVVATRLGAIPEIIEEGVSGYCADSAQDLPQLVARSLTLDRRRIRERAEVRFSGERMARDYAELYGRLAGGGL